MVIIVAEDIMIYKQWLTEWLENYVKPTSKQKTYVRYSEIVTQHIVGGLGGYELNDITPLVLQRFTTDLLKKGNKRTGAGLSANSVNGIITVLQNSLKSACLIGQANEYVADRIKRPRAVGEKVSCFTMREQKKIEKHALGAASRNMFGVVLCLYTGLRIGELLALEWKDIDLVRGTVSVTKSCHDGMNANGRFSRITDTPKTRNSVRTIPLPRNIIPILAVFKKCSRSGYVVASKRGGPVLVRTYQKSFACFLTKLNIPHRGFHALRHTFATRALECGMDVKTLAEILGHKNAGVTLDRYVHSLAEHKKEMMNRLGRIL